MKELIEKLLALNVNEHTEKKNNLTYLSWSWAWATLLKHYPNATYTIQKSDDGIPTFGNSKVGYMCYTTVTVGEITHEMWLPVMDHRNKAILEPNMFDINKTVMRCLTKNLAMFGLGLYIYAGEDLPDGEEPVKPVKKSAPSKLITPKEGEALVTLALQKGTDLTKLMAYYKVTELGDMTVEQYKQATEALNKKEDAHG
jgi:hypothetical protein